MNIQSLKYLVALDDHQHFGKAADACFVSQPTLSMQIKKLEDELDLKLIERTNKSMVFTSAGLQILTHARTALKEISAIKDTASIIKDPYSGIIHLGVIPTLLPYLLPHIIPTLKKHFPKLTLHLTEEKTEHLLLHLKKGSIDACIMADPIYNSNITHEKLFNEAFVVSVPQNHPMSKRTNVCIEDLHAEELLLLDEGHCLRDQILELCETTDASENKSFRGTSIETLRHMVSSNAGITLMPLLACKSNDGTINIPFSGTPPFREIIINWRNTSPKSTLLKEMSEAIQMLRLNELKFSDLDS